MGMVSFSQVCPVMWNLAQKERLLKHMEPVRMVPKTSYFCIILRKLYWGILLIAILPEEMHTLCLVFAHQ